MGEAATHADCTCIVGRYPTAPAHEREVVVDGRCPVHGWILRQGRAPAGAA